MEINKTRGFASVLFNIKTIIVAVIGFGGLGLSYVLFNLEDQYMYIGKVITLALVIYHYRLMKGNGIFKKILMVIVSYIYIMILGATLMIGGTQLAKYIKTQSFIEKGLVENKSVPIDFGKDYYVSRNQIVDGKTIERTISNNIYSFQALKDLEGGEDKLYNKYLRALEVNCTMYKPSIDKGLKVIFKIRDRNKTLIFERYVDKKTCDTRMKKLLSN